jgi:hypothetical protein
VSCSLVEADDARLTWVKIFAIFSRGNIRRSVVKIVYIYGLLANQPQPPQQGEPHCLEIKRI